MLLLPRPGPSSTLLLQQHERRLPGGRPPHPLPQGAGPRAPRLPPPPQLPAAVPHAHDREPRRRDAAPLRGAVHLGLPFRIRVAPGAAGPDRPAGEHAGGAAEEPEPVRVL